MGASLVAGVVAAVVASAEAEVAAGAVAGAVAEVAAVRAAVHTLAAGAATEQSLQPALPAADMLVMNPLHAPMSLPLHWLPRWMARRHSGPASTLVQSRVEVCPPELFASSLSWRGRLQRWSTRLLHQAAPWLPEPARPVNRLALVKTEFRDSLSDLTSLPAQHLLDRIERARSLREMWHLRSSLYGEVSMALTQSEAERRLARLNRHFPTRTPRPGLATLP